VTVLDVQLSPAHCDWAELHEHALAAERLGFEALWVYDHLAGTPLGGDRMLECFTLLGALAQATSRIELGTMVVNVWNRQPGTVVSAAASVALISRRRFHFGIGAGAAPGSRWAVEQEAVEHELGDSLEERHARVVRVLELCRAEWTADRDERFATFPLPAPPPTTLVGVSGERLATIAGTYADGINVAWDGPRRDRLLAAADAAAGDRPLLRTAWTHFDRALLDPGHPTRQEAERIGLDRLILAELGVPTLASIAG
jgi:alkanesulfonate monooxygenase SsuD/methylene tetrahydromethanopterin reductase-like flavin-dependent oxidoreductase (luciferase family)